MQKRRADARRFSCFREWEALYRRILFELILTRQMGELYSCMHNAAGRFMPSCDHQAKDVRPVTVRGKQT